MTITFDTLGPQFTPAVMVELDRAGAYSGLPRDVKRVLLVGYQTAAATVAVEVITRITSSKDAQTYWGEGSMMAVMAEALLAVNPKAPLYGVSFAEGGAAVAATGTVVFAVNATGSGTCKVWIGGHLFQFGIASADTPTNMGDALVAAIGQVKNLPFTAANGAGTVTVTARNKGAAGNSIRMHGEITAGIATTLAVAATLTLGATEGDPTQALANSEGERYHLVTLGTLDATTLAKLNAHVEKQSTPAVQKWCLGIIGSVDTRSSAETIADNDDSYNVQVVWHQQSEQPVFELAARFAGLRSKKAANIGLDGLELPGISPAHVESKWPTTGDIEAAIEGGLTAIRPKRNGTCLVVRSVITRQTAPIAYRDHTVEEIWHYVCETLLDLFTARVQGKVLKSASPPGRPDTVTPARATALLNEGLMRLDKLDYLQGVQDSIDAGNNFAEIDDVEPTARLNAAFDFIPVGQAHVVAIKGTLKAPL